MNPKVRVIIPKKWIQEIDENWEKFVNNSINRNQTFVVYYSEEGDAMDPNGIPNINFVPDFSFVSEVDFPRTGCYLAKLIRYKGMNYLDVRAIFISLKTSLTKTYDFFIK